MYNAVCIFESLHHAQHAEEQACWLMPHLAFYQTFVTAALRPVTAARKGRTEEQAVSWRHFLLAMGYSGPCSLAHCLSIQRERLSSTSHDIIDVSITGCKQRASQAEEE